MFDVVSKGLLGLKSHLTMVTMVKVYPESFQLQAPCQLLPIPAMHTSEGVRIKFQLRKVLPCWAGPYLEPWELK